MFRGFNGLDRTIFEWFIEMYKQSSKIYLIHLYSAYGFYISQLAGTLSIPVYLNTGKKMLDLRTLTLAGDMQWTYTPSSTFRCPI